MSSWVKVFRPHTLAEALEILTATAPSVAILAGGSDLLLDLEQGRHPPVQALVDITAIPELQLVERSGESLFLGAAYPIAKAIAHPLIQQHAQALVEAGAMIAGPQVRNVATFGGNVAHALPAADGTIALLALGAQAEIASPQGSRRVPLEGLFLGPGRSALRKNELLFGFWLPLRQEGEASAFRRVMRPQGIALPILNMAAWVRRRGQEIDAIRLAVGPAGPTPQRLRKGEAALQGHRWEEATLQNGLRTMLQEVHFRRSPHRASERYRYHLFRYLFSETLQAAWERAETPAGANLSPSSSAGLTARKLD
ncbi:MAG: FAD binding domain-containing protein [Anaerolineales bacterium]